MVNTPSELTRIEVRVDATKRVPGTKQVKVRAYDSNLPILAGKASVFFMLDALRAPRIGELLILTVTTEHYDPIAN